MASEVKWLVENHALILAYNGTVTIDDVLYTTRTGEDMIKQCNNTVHILNDLTQTDGLAPEMQKVGDILKVTRSFMSLDNMGMMVAYGTNNKIIKFLSNLVGQVGRIEFRMFDTYDEAVQFLIHNDTLLADQLTP